MLCDLGVHVRAFSDSQVVESSSLEIFKSCLVVVLGQLALGGPAGAGVLEGTSRGRLVSPSALLKAGSGIPAPRMEMPQPVWVSSCV